MRQLLVQYHLLAHHLHHLLKYVNFVGNKIQDKLFGFVSLGKSWWATSGAYSKTERVRCHSILPYSSKVSQIAWCVFSMGHCRALKTRSFRRCQIIQGMPLFKKNQMQLKRFRSLQRDWSRRHCIIEKDFRGPRLPFFAKKMPQDVSSILPNLLSKRAGEEPMFHWFHRLQAIVEATLINLRRDSLKPFIYHYCLVNNYNLFIIKNNLKNVFY